MRQQIRSCDDSAHSPLSNIPGILMKAATVSAKNANSAYNATLPVLRPLHTSFLNPQKQQPGRPLDCIAQEMAMDTDRQSTNVTREPIMEDCSGYGGSISPGLEAPTAACDLRQHAAFLGSNSCCTLSLRALLLAHSKQVLCARGGKDCSLSSAGAIPYAAFYEGTCRLVPRCREYEIVKKGGVCNRLSGNP